MKSKIVGIVVLMLLATTVVSATTFTGNNTIPTVPTGLSTVHDNKIATYEPGLFDWGVDQKQTKTSKYGITLIPPETNAQSFKPTKDKLTAVSLWIFKHATPPEPVHITVSIRDNLTGQDLATKTIDTSKLTIKSSGTWVLFDFADISTTPEVVYYIVVSGDAGDATNAYCWLFANNDTYTRGETWYKANTGSSWIKWSSGPSNPADFCFKTYFRKPIGGSIQTTVNVQKHPAAYGADVPVWKNSDSWTYRVRTQTYTYSSNGSLYSTCLGNGTMTYTVTAVSADNYTLQITEKNMSGKFYYGPYKFIFTKFMKMTEKDYLQKTNLAEISFNAEFKGPIFWLISKLNFPLPAQLSVSTLTHNNQPNILMPFPLVAGTNGTLNNVHSTSSQKCTLYWGHKVVYNVSGPGDTGPRKYTVEMDNITVPAGTYNAYNVSVNYDPRHYWRSYYVPEVGNYAKRYIYLNWGSTATPKPYDIEEYDLISTTYTP